MSLPDPSRPEAPSPPTWVWLLSASLVIASALSVLPVFVRLAAAGVAAGTWIVTRRRGPSALREKPPWIGGAPMPTSLGGLLFAWGIPYVLLPALTAAGYLVLDGAPSPTDPGARVVSGVLSVLGFLLLIARIIAYPLIIAWMALAFMTFTGAVVWKVVKPASTTRERQEAGDELPATDHAGTPR